MYLFIHMSLILMPLCNFQRNFDPNNVTGGRKLKSLHEFYVYMQYK